VLLPFESAVLLPFESAVLLPFESAVLLPFESAVLLPFESAVLLPFESAVLLPFESAVLLPFESAVLLPFESAGLHILEPISNDTHSGIDRVGQNHIYTVYIRYFWLRNHQIYGVYTRIYTVLANPRYKASDTPRFPKRSNSKRTQVLQQRERCTDRHQSTHFHAPTSHMLICRAGQNHTFIGIYGVYTVFLAGKSPNIRSYTVCVYTVLANPTHTSNFNMHRHRTKKSRILTCRHLACAMTYAQSPLTCWSASRSACPLL